MSLSIRCPTRTTTENQATAFPQFVLGQPLYVPIATVFVRPVACDTARVAPARLPGIPDIPDPNSKPFAAGFLATGPP